MVSCLNILTSAKSWLLLLTQNPLLDADTPEFCYLLNSCSKRIIENLLCTVGQNNLLDVKLFTPR